MSINFIPNDPRAKAPFNSAVIKAPRQDRPPNVAGIRLTGSYPQAKHPIGSAAFVWWQCREAALAAIATFEAIYGSTLKKWPGIATTGKLRVSPDSSTPDLNAYYDRKSLGFFHYDLSGTRVYSGASTDVVAHEAGHAVLDVLRPDLWDVAYLEVGAFHEAFGDCMALLTGLSDSRTRSALVTKGSPLNKRNMLETTAEELSWAIGQLYPSDNGSVPRKALNNYKWVLPSTLPLTAAGGVLINEVHSFGQVFSGCFYDLLLRIFAAQKTRSAQSLWQAAKTTGQLLFAGTLLAQVRARFFRSVGQSMLQADQNLFAGAYSADISAAFRKHGIDLGTGLPFVARTALPGHIRSGSGRRKMTMAASTSSALRRRLNAAPGRRLESRAIISDGVPLVEVKSFRAVDLTGLAEYLNGVAVYVPETVVVARAGGARAAIMSALPDDEAAKSEAQLFVKGLVTHGQIESDTRAVTTSIVRRERSHTTETHRIVTRRHGRFLERTRFSCGCLIA